MAVWQAAEVAESRAWALELQRQAATYRTEQAVKRSKAAAAVADLKVPLHTQATFPGAYPYVPSRLIYCISFSSS